MKIVYTYRVVCQKLSAPELGPYITYGILAARDLCGCQQVVRFISDVSLDRAFVEALARRCTAAQLDPCHLCWTWSRMLSAGKAFRPQRLRPGVRCTLLPGVL